MFEDDLALGKKYEKIAIDILGNGEIERCPENVAFSDYDFKHNGIAYEVKSDRRSYQTGNIVIEYEHTNIPSGISITKADYWFYFVINKDAYTCYKIPVSKIRWLISTGAFKKSSCDNGNSKFHLVPIKELTEFKYTAQVSFN